MKKSMAILLVTAGMTTLGLAAKSPASANKAKASKKQAAATQAQNSTTGITANVAAAPDFGAAVAGAQDPTAAPLSVKIGSMEFTPGGFLDLTSVWRSTNVGSGIGTSFGNIPFSNTPAGHLSENRLSAQNSRVALKVSGHRGDTSVTGYLEADFLGVTPGNFNVSSNSNGMRMRLYWVDVQRGKWEVLGGQSWSMLTPGRKGISPNPSDIFYSQVMDTNYQVGLVWSRQAQLRVVYHPNDHWTAGVSFENPEQYAGAGAVLPSFASGSFDTGSSNATANLHPDIIAKVAYDTKVGGKAMHVEAAGVMRSFQFFDSATSMKNSATGGGISVNANLELFKNFHVIANTFYSDGGGRYIYGLGPDLVVRQNGTISLVHSGSGIGGFEYQISPNWLLYGYYGGAYFQHNFDLSGTTPVGYGFPGAPGSNNKSIQEGTAGITHTFWKDNNYGALQLITQYSYVVRNPWSVTPGSPKNAHTNMAFVDLRYVLP